MLQLSSFLLIRPWMRSLERISNEGQSKSSNSLTLHEARREIHGCNLCEQLRHATMLSLTINMIRDPK